MADAAMVLLADPAQTGRLGEDSGSPLARIRGWCAVWRQAALRSPVFCLLPPPPPPPVLRSIFQAGRPGTGRSVAGNREPLR